MIAVAEAPSNTNPYALVRGAAVLHLPECPHIAKWESVEPASPEELATWEVCSWSQAEIDGVGRTYYDDLDAAMRAFGTAVQTKAQIRGAMAAVDHDVIWIPYSRSYLALGKNGYAVAWIHRTFYVVGDREVLLPDFVGLTHTGGNAEPKHGDVCPRCFMQMPLTGICDFCD